MVHHAWLHEVVLAIHHSAHRLNVLAIALHKLLLWLKLGHLPILHDQVALVHHGRHLSWHTWAAHLRVHLANTLVVSAT